jgi:hypothetical protein
MMNHANAIDQPGSRREACRPRSAVPQECDPRGPPSRSPSCGPSKASAPRRRRTFARRIGRDDHFRRCTRPSHASVSVSGLPFPHGCATRSRSSLATIPVRVPMLPSTSREVLYAHPQSRRSRASVSLSSCLEPLPRIDAVHVSLPPAAEAKNTSPESLLERLQPVHQPATHPRPATTPSRDTFTASFPIPSAPLHLPLNRPAHAFPFHGRWNVIVSSNW